MLARGRCLGCREYIVDSFAKFVFVGIEFGRGALDDYSGISLAFGALESYSENSGRHDNLQVLVVVRVAYRAKSGNSGIVVVLRSEQFSQHDWLYN